MHPSLRTLLLACLLSSAGGFAYADITNFDTQAAGAPSSFVPYGSSPLTIGNATFGGGQLLNHEIGGVDATGVYATSGYTAGFNDQITISFATGVDEVSLVVTNNTPGTFWVSDNVGQYGSKAIGYDGEETFSLLGTGITYVTISEGAANDYLFDFAIDNVTTGVGGGGDALTPEPGPAVLLLTGMSGLAGVLRRRSLTSAAH